jgi:hypothetical protein
MTVDLDVHIGLFAGAGCSKSEYRNGRSVTDDRHHPSAHSPPAIRQLKAQKVTGRWKKTGKMSHSVYVPKCYGFSQPPTKKPALGRLLMEQRFAVVCHGGGLLRV